MDRKIGYNLTTGGKNFQSSEETRNKISLSQIGSKNHFYGKTHTPEVVKFLSEMMKKRGNLQLGRKRSKASRKRMSEAQRLLVKQGKKMHPKHPIFCNENGIFYSSQTEAVRKLKLNPGSLHAVLNGTRTHTHGYTFRYVLKHKRSPKT